MVVAQAVSIDPDSSNTLNITGSATLGGKLSVTQNPGTYPASGQYVILQAAAGFTSSFTSVEIQNLPDFHFTLGQNGNKLILSYEKLSRHEQLPLAEESPYHEELPFNPDLYPPTQIRARQIKQSGSKKVTNIINWKPPEEGVNPIVYKVYRNSLEELISVVPANKLRFKDPNCSVRTKYTYYITSVDEQDASSSPAKITIKPKKRRQ